MRSVTRNSLLTVAFGAALLLPAAAAVTAGSADAAPRTAKHAKVLKAGKLKRHVIVPSKKLQLRRCMGPIRRIVYREMRRLRAFGYRSVRIKSVYQFRPRCTQIVRLTACRGIRKYEFEIRYRFGRKLRTYVYNAGFCRRFYPHPRPRFRHGS